MSHSLASDVSPLGLGKYFALSREETMNVETEVDDPLQGQDSETRIDDQNSN